MLHIELYFIQAYRETVPFQAFLIREILGKVQATLLQGHYLFLVNCCIMAQLSILVQIRGFEHLFRAKHNCTQMK